MWEDTNMDGLINSDEISYYDPASGDPPPEDFLEYTLGFTDDLQNQTNHIDLLYGREWGGRRYSGRWWAGMRYFTYEGNLVGTAWLQSGGDPGLGFSDGLAIRMFNFRQETTGIGPTGSMEARFNFFEGLLQAYLKGEAAFIVSDLSADSGPFFSLAVDPVDLDKVFLVDGRLDLSKDKSAWHTGAEVGVRIKLANGLRFDLSYHIRGYLDSVLYPDGVSIPRFGSTNSPKETGKPTQDLVFDGGRFGIGFQF
jgi:hypothetical protein